MDIIFQGEYNAEEAAENLLSVLRLFKERYAVEQFREMHLHLTLVDGLGEEVELVDNRTSQVFRVFQVCRHDEFTPIPRPKSPLELVIDNTAPK